MFFEFLPHDLTPTTSEVVSSPSFSTYHLRVTSKEDDKVDSWILGKPSEFGAVHGETTTIDVIRHSML